MKRLLFIGALAGPGAREAHAQTIKAMTEQLIELNVFNRSTVSGYHLMTNGLDSVAALNENEYVLHVNYFQSLNVLDPGLGVSPDKVKRLNILMMEIKKLLYDEAPAPARNGGRLAIHQ